MTPFAFFPNALFGQMEQLPRRRTEILSDKAHRKKQSEGVVTYVELLLRSNAV